MPRNVTVRAATDADLPDLLGVLDAAALETDADCVRASIDRGDAFVAVRSDTDATTVLGALVLVPADSGREDTARIDAVAVRRNRRGQGIGRALVAAAADEYDRLSAEFDSGVRPFYESLGFRIEATRDDADDRLRGVSATEDQRADRDNGETGSRDSDERFD